MEQVLPCFAAGLIAEMPEYRRQAEALIPNCDDGAGHNLSPASTIRRKPTLVALMRPAGIARTSAGVGKVRIKAQVDRAVSA